MKIAIIGAGLSAISAALNLKKNVNITIFEKSNNVGGRMAVRRSNPYEFDHGAQFFTAKNNDFRNFIAPLIKENIIQRWDARFAEFNNNTILRQNSWGAEYPHFVGVPDMNKIIQYLSKNLNVKLNKKINKITKNSKNQWILFDDNFNDLGSFDWVISSAPAEQSAIILPQEYKHQKQLLQKKMVGCFSLMLGFKDPLSLSWDAALIGNADISWISVNSSKPGRSKSFSLLVHSTNAWAEKNINKNDQKIISYMCRETSRIISHDISIADHIGLHKWKYANIEKQDESNLLIDYDNKLASCGDWIIHGRIESAFKSGYLLAKSLNKEF